LTVAAKGADLDAETLRVELTARAVMFLAAGLVTGYLARARDAERRQRERMDWELRVARQVQAGMLPAALPEPPGYELGAEFASAQAVGGDYYDALEGPDGRLFVVIADVAGKSVFAVMHLSLLRSALREAIIAGLAPGAIAHRLNQTLAGTLAPNSFVSLFCGALDLKTGTLRYVNCGHTPPIHVHPDPAPEPDLLFTGNIVLGIEPGAVYDERETRLEPGDCLVCCTDGVTEALGPDWEPFDTAGVTRAVRAQPGASAGALALAVLEASDRHREAAAADDATILVVRRLDA
jgi:sigma-B regulation protein RsbU (phosphoserine phosphatase)